MREQLLPILYYMFENHVVNYELQTTKVDDLLADLQQAGFDEDLSLTAIFWLNEILSLHQAEAMHTNTESIATRAYSPEEYTLLSTKIRGHILYLEQAGILNPVTRERVINRLTSSNERPIEIEHLEFVTMVVLENDHEQNPNALYSMEELMAAQEGSGIH